jgi:hypothetical protein
MAAVIGINSYTIQMSSPFESCCGGGYLSRLADVGAAGRTHRKGGWSDDFRQISIRDVSESPTAPMRIRAAAYVEAGLSAAWRSKSVGAQLFKRLPPL